MSAKKTKIQIEIAKEILDQYSTVELIEELKKRGIGAKELKIIVEKQKK